MDVENATQSSSIMEAKTVHPLHQISELPTHDLLLKRWLKEEDLNFNRIVAKETQIDSFRKEIKQLCCLFFLFQSLCLTIFFSSVARSWPKGDGIYCRRSWIPSLCSLGMIWAIRYKADTEAHLEKLLEREKEDGKLIRKCVEELKKKGKEFDLVEALMRRSMKVEGKAVVRKWSGTDLITLFFIISCVVLSLTNLILCG